jgi:hypothetical protein
MDATKLRNVKTNHSFVTFASSIPVRYFLLVPSKADSHEEDLLIGNASRERSPCSLFATDLCRGISFCDRTLATDGKQMKQMSSFAIHRSVIRFIRYKSVAKQITYPLHPL